MNVRRGRRVGLFATALGTASIAATSAWIWRAESARAQTPVFQTVPPAPRGDDEPGPAGPPRAQTPVFQTVPPAPGASEDHAGRRPVRGYVDLGRISKGFSHATVVLTLRRDRIPNNTAPSPRVAELHLFDISKSPDQALALPFSLGDFAPSAEVAYSLECFIDVNRSGKLDVGDFWNQRQVRVLSPEAPDEAADKAVIQDFMAVVEAR